MSKLGIVKWIAAAGAGAALLAGASALGQDAPPAATLSELLQRIQEENRSTSAEARAREEEFRRKRDQQAALLANAKAELEALEAKGKELEGQFAANDGVIAELSDQLKVKSGTFGELFGIARQAAAEAAASIDASIVSAQFPGRSRPLVKVAESNKLPTRGELDAIWKSLIGEMVHQREVVTFKTKVDNYAADGKAGEATVTRIGVFTLFATDRGRTRFLTFKGREGEPPTLKALARNPAGAIVGAAKSVAGSGPGRLVGGPIDPSRGDLIGLVVENPTFRERVDQGGTVGYFTISVAGIGIVFGLFRLFQLTLTGAAVRGQIGRPANKGNPLGRVLIAAEENRGKDLETFELKLDEAIVKNAASLDYGLNFVKLAAGVSPLLGLLGTVVGMIQTFQQITLFGAGDPKIMAGGISTALVTTVIGLVSAIPLLFIHSLCSSASRSVQQVLEEQAAGIVADHAKNRGGR